MSVKKILLVFVLLIIAFFASITIWYFFIIQIPEPILEQVEIRKEDLIKVNDSSFRYQDAWLRKNRFGLWEMYISGKPEELGIKNGILAQELIRKQEEAFIKQIRKMVPDEGYLNFLKYVTSFINYQLPEYIPNEYLREIKAVSNFASDDFDFIGDNYARQLNYHAAHDIGHAMQNLHLVECTAFGVNHKRSSDSSLLIGRNFDFYVGDEFAENKIILFVKPASGYSFASITWGGMIGVVSGMNSQGLTITLNSAKSDIPIFAKTPVSIIARDILQYASTIQEAFEIAKKYPSFVAESFMISSAIDDDMAIIEKTPDQTVLYQTETDQLVLTNHFQSKEFYHTKINQENIKENVTDYRFDRVEELLNEDPSFNEHDFARILRDTKGWTNEDIGLGNEGAINQLIAHHSIIFKPQSHQFWISSSPYQLGEYVCYQLDSIFSSAQNNHQESAIASGLIPRDSVFLIEKYPQYLHFKKLKEDILNHRGVNMEELINSNPHFFYSYELAGDYSKSRRDFEMAKFYYQKALNCFVPNQHETNRITEKLEELPL